jgi:hypothetical protein
LTAWALVIPAQDHLAIYVLPFKLEYPEQHVSQHFSGQDPELRYLDLALGYNSHQPTGKLVASLNLLTAVIEFDFFPAFRIHVLAAARAKLPSRAYPEY